MNILRTIFVCGHKINIYGTINNPLFLAIDVAKITGYNVSDIYHKLKEKVVDKSVLRYEEGNFTILTENKINLGCYSISDNSWYLTEYSFYKMLMQSRKLISKRFKSKVKNILHDLRIAEEAKVIKKEETCTYTCWKNIKGKKVYLGEYCSKTHKEIAVKYDTDKKILGLARTAWEVALACGIDEQVDNIEEAEICWLNLWPKDLKKK